MNTRLLPVVERSSKRSFKLRRARPSVALSGRGPGGGFTPARASTLAYRIQSPVVVIEFDHQKPVGLRHLIDPNVPTVEPVHTVVRTPNGNDYGKDLLRQHYALHAH